MTEAQIEVCDALWREALAAGLVRWMPGMLVLAPDWQPLRLAHEYMRSVWSGIAGDETGHDYAHNIGDDALPFWADPATIGCLLAMAREVTGDQTLYACVVPGALLDGDDKWCALLDRRMPLIQAHTEPEALLRAILATRGKR